MKKRILALICTVGMVAAVFAGCTSSGNEQSSVAPSETSEPVSAAESQSAAESAGESTPAGAPSGSITLWGWEDAAFAEAITRFNKQYPDVEVIYTPVGSSEYVQKVQTALTAGTELPDVACLELDSRGKLFTFDCWENLENGEYSFDRGQIVDYLIPLMTNDNGEIVCIDWQLCPSGIAYKRDLTKEYLGTDDPAELAALLPTWDAFVEQGVKVKDASEGKVKMMAGLGDINRIVFNQIDQPIIADGKINVKDSFGTLFDIQAKMRDAGVTGILDIWSPAWTASFADKEHIFYPCATWVPFFFIEANDPGGKGNWGLMQPPGGGYNWGGTAFAISKTSENKQAAWAFIEWILLSEEGVQFNDEITGYPTPLKEKYNDPAYVSAPNEFFGGQDIKSFFFTDLMPEVNMRPISAYDVALWDIVGLETTDLNSNPSLTAEQALEKAVQEVKNKMPELEIIE